MKWDFFYDEGSSRPYRSLGDWYHEIRHLLYPLIIVIGVGIVIFIYVKCFPT